ncbi:MAG TPA: DUF3568 family protein [Bacillota bacterium]|nr:DUF3568 family protein [Bacillota bacterium]
MKIKLFVSLLGALVLVTSGCVKTVTERSTAGVPFIKDTITGNYERPLDQVYNAAKAVVSFNGTLINESIMHTETNVVKTVEGKINQRRVWVRVESQAPKITTVAVQTRTPGGRPDLDLAHEVEKQIALKLVQ